MDPQNLMSTLQQLSNLSGANLTPQMGLNQFGNDLSSLPWAAGHQAWLDSAKVAAMYASIMQSASVNDQVQQLNAINTMNTLEQSLKLLAQQNTNSTVPPQSQTAMANTQPTLQNQLETMLQNELLLQQQQQVSTANTTKDASANNLAQLLQLSQQPNTNDFLASNLQSILGLATSSSAPATTPSTTRTFQCGCKQLQQYARRSTSKLVYKLYEKALKRADQKGFNGHCSTAFKFSSHQLPNNNEPANHATLLSRISQSNLLAADPNLNHNQMPSTSASIQQQSNGIDDFDLNALHEMLFDKNKDLDPFLNHPDFGFEFNEALIKELHSNAVAIEPEPTFNQAELEPQFTPPDSPQPHHQLKIDSLSSGSTNLINTNGLMLKQEPAFLNDANALNFSTNHLTSIKKDPLDMPLVFIPPVKEEPPVKKPPIQTTTKKSSLLQSVNKVPIYKQKFITATAPSLEAKGEDCYSFVDDEFDLPTALKAPTASIQKEQETVQSVKSSERAERHSTNASVRKLPQIKDVRETRQYIGTPWCKEFLDRMDRNQVWVSVNPFECTDIQTDEPFQDLAWTAEPFKKTSIRVVIKEEPAVVNPETEEAARPRLVLKFIKPKENENEVPSTSTKHENHHHHSSKKHKKHKKKDRDTEWEYPGQPKRHKKKHHHKHRHHVKSETVEDNDESNPAYNTRSAISVKTENLDYSSPAHSSHSHASNKNEYLNNHKTSTADVPFLIGSRLNEQFIRRYRSFAQTQSDLPKGVFVVAKEDVWKEDCPLWRIDSFYTNTSNFTGWADEVAEQYFVVHVEILKQTRAETIVKPTHPLETLFPAIPNEDASIFCVEDNDTEMQVDLNDMSNESVLMTELVVELLQRQCAHSRTLEEAHSLPDSKTTRALREFQRRCLECTEEMQVEEMIRPDICLLLDHYNSLITFPSSSTDEDECLSCGQNGENMQRVGLHGGEKYDPDLLTIQERNDEAFGNAMDIAVCEQCVDQIKFYHQNRHALFHLYKRCENQFIDLALERPTATANALLNLALKDKEFARIVIRDVSPITPFTQYDFRFRIRRKSKQRLLVSENRDHDVFHYYNRFPFSVAKITSARVKLDEASASELFTPAKDEQADQPTASDEVGPAGSNCQCSYSSDDNDSDDLYESELDESPSGTSDTASSSYKDNWRQTQQQGRQIKTARKKKGALGAGAKLFAGLEEVGKNLQDNGQFPFHSHISGLKSVANTCSQTNDHVMPMMDEGGTTANELLLSSSVDPQPLSVSNELFGKTKWPIAANMRDVLELNKNPMTASSLFTRLIDSNMAAVSSECAAQHLYCHRSIGTQTLPDNEYPSHVYYSNSDFGSHVVEPAEIKYILPEELPSRKHIAQDSQSEGTLRLVIQNFSLMTDTVRGPSKVVQGVPWLAFNANAEATHCPEKRNTKMLGLLFAMLSGRLLRQLVVSGSCRTPTNLTETKYNKLHTQDKSCLHSKGGYSCFITWSDILDENQGYILNDVVILEVQVKAERAKNILSLGEFRKKINEYIRVSQMQCDRGLIDKAIDCNSQAMKFCKDKDPECLKRLQEQNADLVARKLKQSIARIERGGEQQTTETADPAANITALRNAMIGSNSNKPANSSRSKRSKDSKTSEKRRENDQASDQNLNADNNSVDNQSLKNEAIDASPVENSLENNGQVECAEYLDPVNSCSASELHTYDCHCNKSLTYEQLASIDPEHSALMDRTDLMKCIEDAMDDRETIQLMNEVLSEDLFEEAPEKLLPFRFELLARSLICHGGYTFADIVEQESNALFQLITNQKNLIQQADYPEEGLSNFDPNDKAHQNVCKSIRKYLMTVSNGSQTEFPALSEVMGNKKERRSERQATDKELDELVRKIDTAEAHLNALTESERAKLESIQCSESTKRTTSAVEKKLKEPAQKELLKPLSQKESGDKAARRRGRAATPSGNPSDFVARADFKNGKLIRIKKDSDGRFNAVQGGSKSVSRKSTFEVFSSSSSSKGIKTQTKMQFECDGRSYDFFNQMISSFPSADSFSASLIEQMSRSQLEAESSNDSPTSANRSFEYDPTKFGNFDEEMHFQDLTAIQNFLQANKIARNNRRTRCSSYPPPANNHFNGLTENGNEYHDTLVRISLHLYELVNRTVEATTTTTTFFQDHMNNLFQLPNVYEFPTLVNAVLAFCTECNLEKNLEEMHVLEPGKIALKPLAQQECARFLFDGQGEKQLLQHYDIYFSTLQAILCANHIEIVPLIKKIMAYALDQRQKNEELVKEAATLRSEQKAWSKEKNQIQKIQKNEKTLNQRYETAKTECNQLKNQQKSWHKREAELNDEVCKLRQNVESLTSKIQERDAQHSRDVQASNRLAQTLQSLHDVKRNHSKELADRQAATQKLKEQVDEKTALTKKLEQQCAQEKRNSQKLAERVKATEILLVESRAEQAVKLLERSRTDAEVNIKQIDDRIEAGGLSDEELNTLKKDASALQKYKDDVNKLIEESRNEGLKHVEQIKEGKQLSQLPKAAFAKPPMLPTCQPIPPIRKPQPPVEVPKVFLSPHAQPPIQPASIPSMSIPPPQANPSAFRPLNNNPMPPTTFNSSQPPPTQNYLANGSVQQQMMAQYMPQAQQPRPNIPIFTPNTPAPIIPPTTPGPIGSRPLNFQSNNGLSDQLRTSGLDRPNLTNFVATEPPTNYNRSCTPAELEQIERMRNVRSLWEKDGNSSSTDSNNPAPLNPANPAKFFPPTTPFGTEFAAKAPGSNVNGQQNSTVSGADIWGGSYGGIWSSNS
ncbi:MATH domain-containing protein [Aphelenchoides bicaudatus]|nr:MATH domain-containing protein [Aphelenchoides bicaudatus]